MKLKKKKHSLLSLCLFLITSMFWPCESVCQNISFISHLEKKDGLSDRIVNNITRDTQGYFYLFFNQNVQRYDGRNFIDLNNQFEPKRANYNTQFIYNDNKNTPIAIVDNKPSKSFFIQTNQLNVFTQSPLIEFAPPADSIFISGNQHQLFSFKKDNNVFSISLFDNPNIEFTLSDITLPKKTFYSKKSKTLFLEYANGTILAFNNKNQLLMELSGKLCLRGNEVLLINKTGIFTWKKDRFHTIQSFPKNQYKCLWVKKDNMDNLMISYHKDVARVVKIIILKPSNQIIPYNKVLDHVVNIKDVYADNFFKEILIASFNALYIMKFQDPGIDLIFNMELTKNSIFGNVITGVQKVESNNTLYFIRETDGLHKYTLNDKESSSRINTSIDYSNSNSLKFDSITQNLYSTRYNFEGTGNLNVYNTISQVQKQIDFTFSPSGLSEIQNNTFYVYGSYRDKNHMDSEYRGTVSKFDINTNTISNLNFPVNTLQNSIRSFYYDKESEEYWLGSSNGLFIIDKSYQVVQEYNNLRSDQKYNINIPHIRLIKRFGNHVFIGTKGDGLYIIDYKTKHIISHKSQEGDLTDNNIIAAEQSSNGNYWIASFNGITVFDSSLKLVHKLYDKDGISNPEFNTQASCQSKKGKIYFGSINGITALSPEKILSASNITNINIESVQTYENGKISSISQDQFPIKLSETIDSFSLQYNIPQYFKHYYEEQKDFIEIRNEHNQNIRIDNQNITVRDISKGIIHLDLGKPNDTKITQLEFNVVRNYIPLLITLLSISSIIAIWYLFTAQKIRANRELEEEKTKFNKKLAELELTALRSQMNPHFIFNALGAVQYFINTKDIEKADGYLTKFAKLMRSILESSKSKYIRLQDEIDMLKLYVSLEHIRFEEKFTYSFQIQEDIDALDFKIPSMIIQPVVENAINHGLYHLADRKGQLIISFIEIHEDHVICTVKDNGIGREASTKLRKKKTHKSRGMQIVDERINALKLNEEFDIKINTSDLNTPTTGTIVEISIERKPD